MNPVSRPNKMLRLARAAASFPLLTANVQTGELFSITGYIWWALAGVLIILFNKKIESDFPETVTGQSLSSILGFLFGLAVMDSLIWALRAAIYPQLLLANILAICFVMVLIAFVLKGEFQVDSQEADGLIVSWRTGEAFTAEKEPDDCSVLNSTYFL